MPVRVAIPTLARPPSSPESRTWDRAGRKIQEEEEDTRRGGISKMRRKIQDMEEDPRGGVRSKRRRKIKEEEEDQRGG